jgi:hypothetical protein
MMSTNMTMPDTTYKAASHTPAKMTHKMLPIVLTSVSPYCALAGGRRSQERRAPETAFEVVLERRHAEPLDLGTGPVGRGCERAPEVAPEDSTEQRDGVGFDAAATEA